LIFRPCLCDICSGRRETSPKATSATLPSAFVSALRFQLSAFGIQHSAFELTLPPFRRTLAAWQRKQKSEAGGRRSARLTTKFRIAPKIKRKTRWGCAACFKMTVQEILDEHIAKKLV